MGSPLRPHSLRTGAVVALVTYGAFACAVILACLGHFGQRLALAAAREEALAVAATAALSADGAGHMAIADSNDQRALHALSARQARLWAAGPRGVILYSVMRQPTHAGWRYTAVSADATGNPRDPGAPVVGHYRPLLERALIRTTVDPTPRKGVHGTYLRAYSPVRAPDGSAVAVQVAELHVPFADLLYDARWIALAAVLAVLCLGVGVGLWRSWPVARDLRMLAQASERLARGHRVEPLPVGGHVELAHLTQTFNDMIQAMEARSHDANTDGLTGLYNHRYFRERLAQEVARASRYSHRVALLMIDIDHFKLFNDRYGHPAGDDVLQQVARIIRQTIRDIDVAARYGGEEFVVIMPEADSFTGLEQAELIRLAVGRFKFDIKTDQSLNQGRSQVEEPDVAISIGIAECPANASDPQSLVTVADLALLRAKQMGRDRVCAYQTLDVIEGEGDCRELHRLLDEERDRHTGSPSAAAPFSCTQCRSVTRYAMTLAHALGLAARDAEEVRRSALWLDVNRARERQAKRPLEQPPPASGQDRLATAAALLERTFRVSSVPTYVVHRHEWYNGHGYPDRLAGEEIPLGARILAIADNYESLLAGNGHGAPPQPEDALRLLDGMAGTQLDPGLVATFRATIERGESDPGEVPCARSGADRRSEVHALESTVRPSWSG